ncbi:MAG TPA: hypothetical protein VGK27_11725 [Candidatus Deferrimicrobiaceae bacterium]|jgi:hypothetical protein
MTFTHRILFACLAAWIALTVAGCGGGGGASTSGPSISRTLTWSPPTAYQDNSPLDPGHDLAGYNIYIKSEEAPFSEQDAEIAVVAPGQTSLDLVPVCRLQGLAGGTFHVSVRAIAMNGLMSEFSPTASFSLPDTL